MLSSGSRLGPYEIIAPLGAGGMGEVYKARDTRLNRIVAIKVLPEALAVDPQFRQRFDQEARAVAALNHPNICTLHDVGRQDSTDFLVMELLEGETLADRLKKGAVPLDEALPYAMQIADALARAHRAGIVHRDLKPGNIFLARSGGTSGAPVAKLLDFGLAKAGGVVAPGAGLSMLPTTPAGLTAQGTILGTFQYMAPEQLEGKDADARTDIFAFGAVLHEMLTGKKAFEGSSHASLISSIMTAHPPAVSSIHKLMPPALDDLVARCLAKDPDDRWQSARDLKMQLAWIAGSGGVAAPASGGNGPRASFPGTARMDQCAVAVDAGRCCRCVARAACAGLASGGRSICRAASRQEHATGYRACGSGRWRRWQPGRWTVPRRGTRRSGRPTADRLASSREAS
jgi:serine/threonine protein kinase